MSVYAVICDELSMVKIGTTGGSIDLRFSQIDASSPIPLRLLWQQPGDPSMERSLHRTFTSRHVRYEWFDFTGLSDPVAELDAAYRLLLEGQPERTAASVLRRWRQDARLSIDELAVHISSRLPRSMRVSRELVRRYESGKVRPERMDPFVLGAIITITEPDDVTELPIELRQDIEKAFAFASRVVAS